MLECILAKLAMDLCVSRLRTRLFAELTFQRHWISAVVEWQKMEQMALEEGVEEEEEGWVALIGQI